MAEHEKGPRYALVGGNPFRGYTNTLTFTSLKVIGTCNTLKQLKALVNKSYDDAGGLLLPIDLHTGKPVEGEPELNF